MKPNLYVEKLAQLNRLKRVHSELPNTSSFKYLKKLSEVEPDVIEECFTEEVKDCFLDCIADKIQELKAELNVE